MDLIDISTPLSAATPVWPGSTPVRLERRVNFDASSVRVTQLTMDVHAGSHVDAPAHFLADGAELSQIPLSLLVGPCRVLDVSAAVDSASGLIDSAGLEAAGFAAGVTRQGITRVLLRTRREGFWDQSLEFDEKFAALSLEAARHLIDAGVRLVGIDAPSLETFSGDGAVHRELLGAGVVLLETLRLSHVAPGPYELICLPLALQGTEAAPVRAVLRRR